MRQKLPGSRLRRATNGNGALSSDRNSSGYYVPISGRVAQQGRVGQALELKRAVNKDPVSHIQNTADVGPIASERLHLGDQRLQGGLRIAKEE